VEVVAQVTPPMTRAVIEMEKSWRQMVAAVLYQMNRGIDADRTLQALLKKVTLALSIGASHSGADADPKFTPRIPIVCFKRNGHRVEEQLKEWGGSEGGLWIF
jgi:hypothetical protein